MKKVIVALVWLAFIGFIFIPTPCNKDGSIAAAINWANNEVCK